ENEFRGLQVKSLTKQKNTKNVWTISCHTEYVDDTLIVGIDQKNNRYCLYFYKDYITKKKIRSFCFSSKKINKQKNVIKFANLDSFKKKLFEMIKQTTIIKNNDLTKYLSESYKKENAMLQRLEAECQDRGILYKRNNTNSNTIDCYLNGKSAQCKYSDSI